MVKSKSTNLVVFSLFCYVCFCTAYQQYITFFSETNYRGDSLTITRKHGNTLYVQEFMASSQSYRAHGYWNCFSGVNYTGNSTILRIGDSEMGFINYTAANRASIRHSGLVDTTQQSISIYSNTSRNGIENTITNPAANNFAFVPLSLFTTGFSNWTFFTGTDFDGEATCYISTAQNHYLDTLNENETISNINSILKGCLGHIDSYFYAEDVADLDSNTDFDDETANYSN